MASAAAGQARTQTYPRPEARPSRLRRVASTSYRPFESYTGLGAKLEAR